MQPINQFQGAPTSAMNFPVAEYLQANQNAQNTYLQGQQALQSGISKGIGAVADAYKDYKKMESDVKTGVTLMETLSPHLDPETRASMQKTMDTIKSDPKMSLMDKYNLIQGHLQLAGGVISQANKIAQINAEYSGKMGLAQEANKLKGQSTAVIKAGLGGLESLGAGFDQAASNFNIPSSPVSNIPSTGSPAVNQAALFTPMDKSNFNFPDSGLNFFGK